VLWVSKVRSKEKQSDQLLNHPFVLLPWCQHRPDFSVPSATCRHRFPRLSPWWRYPCSQRWCELSRGWRWLSDDRLDVARGWLVSSSPSLGPAWGRGIGWRTRFTLCEEVNGCAFKWSKVGAVAPNTIIVLLGFPSGRWYVAEPIYNLVCMSQIYQLLTSFFS
jgi:hypothetical protein